MRRFAEEPGTQLLTAALHGAGESERAQAVYPPIGDYAAIGDCRSAALVSRGGSIDWLCWPHFAAPSVFGALLDRERGGCFELAPAGVESVTRRYVEGTNVLETIFTTSTGRVKLTDLLSIERNGADDHELHPQRELLRAVEILEGSAELRLRFAPRPDYARLRPRLKLRGSGLVRCAWDAELMTLRGDVPLSLAEGEAAATAQFRIAEGERRYFSLCYSHGEAGVIENLGPDADRRIEQTVAWWQEWSGRCRYQGPYADHVLRSALALKMMTYALSGAIVAAPTTSLPEEIGGERNWDYRYCWLRDASVTLGVLLELGFSDEGAAFFDWLLHATRLTQPRLEILYGLYGVPADREEELRHLEGYRGSRPVRIGNGARSQLQLDVYGAVCLAARRYVSGGGMLDLEEKHLLAGFGKLVVRCWREPDEGIWEYRAPRRHNVYSKLLCWVALDSLIALDRDVGLPIDRKALEAEREQIRQAIDERGWSAEHNAYVGAFDHPAADASLLVLARSGYLPADHPRIRGTFDYIEAELGRAPLVYRYRPGTDGLEGGEGTFGIASFWAVDYLARIGETDRALERFEALLGYANDVGLYAEEIDPDNGEALGNFPQAYTHVGLLMAACTLTRAMNGSGTLESSQR